MSVQSTEASRRCRLAGDYLLSPGDEAVALLAVGSGHAFYRWLCRVGQVEVRNSERWSQIRDGATLRRGDSTPCRGEEKMATSS